MLTREQVLTELKNIMSDNNKYIINNLSARIESMDEASFENILKEKQINTLNDIRSFVESEESVQQTDKFTQLNELVSYGEMEHTIHIHVVPKDARSSLTREGRRNAELSLIDATEKIKYMVQTDPKYKGVKNIYAVSSIVKGPIARWFKNIGYDIRTLTINEAKNDAELSKFYEVFKDHKQLGRAMIGIDKLMTSEWEELKNARKKALSVQQKTNDKKEDIVIETIKNDFVDELQNLNKTDCDFLDHEEKMENNKKPNIKDIESK